MWARGGRRGQGPGRGGGNSGWVGSACGCGRPVAALIAGRGRDRLRGARWAGTRIVGRGPRRCGGAGGAGLGGGGRRGAGGAGQWRRRGLVAFIGVLGAVRASGVVVAGRAGDGLGGLVLRSPPEMDDLDLLTLADVLRPAPPSQGATPQDFTRSRSGSCPGLGRGLHQVGVAVFGEQDGALHAGAGAGGGGLGARIARPVFKAGLLAGCLVRVGRDQW